MAKKRISMGAWAYIWAGYAEHPIPLPEVAKCLQDLGFDGIEMAAYRPHFAPADFPSSASRREVKMLLEDHGLAVSALAGSFGKVPPALTPPAQYLEVVKIHLDMCQDIGSPKLRLDTVSPPTDIPGGMDYERCFWQIVDIYRQAAELSADAGVRLVWEFEPSFLFNKPSEVVRMVNAVGHRNFSVLFDTSHAYMCGVVGARQLGERETLPGGVVQFAKMLTGNIGHVHFIDSDATLHDNDTSTHAQFGHGVLNFDEIVPAILDAGYTDEWWTVDLCFWPKALDATAPAKRFMDALVQKYGS